MKSHKADMLKVGFIGGARYPQPLDPTNEKKFKTLTSIGELFIVGFSKDLKPRWFTEYAHFYLLPLLPIAFLRYIELFTIAPLLVLWLIFRRNIRVIVAQSPYEGVVAALIKKIVGWFGHKIVLVIESHGDFEESFFLYRRIPVPAFTRMVMRAVARFSLENADVLRAISYATYQQLKQWEPKKPVIQFVAWTNIEVFLQVGRERKECSSPTFLYAGVLTPLKGIIHLVNAFFAITKDFPEARLVILGSTQDQGYVSEVKALVTKLGLTGQIQFVPEVPQQELAQWMARAYVFVLPSLSEGLGRVIIEAMAAGVPVIGTRVGGIPDVIQDGVTGFLTPLGDEMALAEKLRWCLEHPDLTKDMGSKAHIFARSFFSTEIWLRHYRQIFETAQMVLTQRNAPS